MEHRKRKDAGFRTNLNVHHLVKVHHPMCRCSKCHHVFAIQVGLVKRTDDYDNRIEVDLHDQASCNYCPNCGWPSSEFHMHQLRENLECMWSRDPEHPSNMFACASGDHYHAEQEAADNCDYCRWAEKYSYRCPECDAEYPDSDQALMCASKCMQKHMLGETE